MAQLKRSEIITEATTWAGRKAETVDLEKAFNFVVKNMSEKYALLPTSESGNLTADQNYIALPTDYRSHRTLDVGGRYKRKYSGFKVDDDWLRICVNPADFYYYDQTEYGTPVLYTIEAAVIYTADSSPAIGKVLFYPMTETTTPAYTFHYFRFHPKSWKTWTGLADKTDISFTASTKTIASAAAEFDTEACAVGRKLTVSGSNNNDGTYTIVSATTAAVVVSETLVDEAAGASVTITVETGDNYLHEYGERWDEVVIHGVAWRCARRVGEATKTNEEFTLYSGMLDEMAGLLTKRPDTVRVQYYHF